MALPGDDEDIFAAGPEPEAPAESAPESTIAPTEESQAVSSMIRGMQTAPSRLTPTPPPPHPRDKPTPGQEQSPAGLLRELLNERDKRQGLETKLERFERLEAEAKARETQPKFEDRFFQQPEQELTSFVDQRVQPYEDRLRNLQADFDMRFAAMRHGEEFDEAFQTWFQAVGDMSRPNPQLYWGVMNSPSPGEAIMQWFSGLRDQREIGDGGLKAYKERIIAETLAQYGINAPVSMTLASTPNPNVERAENGQFTPRHEVRLPTATSRLSPAGRGGARGEIEDGSEEAIFDTGRQRR